MALLRLSHQPPVFSHQIPLNQTNHKNLNASISLTNCSLSSFSHHLAKPLRIKTRRVSDFILRSSATTEDAVAEASSSSVDSTTNSEHEEESSRTRLLAQNIPWTSTPEDIRSLFEKYGKVLDVELSMYSKTKNRGLAFVTMGSPEEAVAALTNLESYEYEGRTVKVAYAHPKKEKPAPSVKPSPVPTFNLFVANLPFEARDKDLKEFFDAGSGSVVSAQVVWHDNPRRSSGYAFVAFNNKKDAETALSTFAEKDFMGRPLRVQRSKQFVKVPVKEPLQSVDASPESSEEQ